MGRRYYCNYCDKRIPPGLSHRKNHNKGIQHINNKTIYYLQFKGWKIIYLYWFKRKLDFYLEPIEILLDERSKRMCKQWNQTGSCSFGENCKYSHRFNYEIIQFIEQQSFSFEDF